MSSDPMAISVRGLTKNYSIRSASSGHTTLAEVAVHRIRHPLSRAPRQTFTALDEVSFDVKQGEVIGLIGHNGAGKSTLLKVLSRIVSPSGGRVDIWGRVGSLLEVGTGFHPELTGRENVFLNGAILGMSTQEIRERFDAIVDFAGIDTFLDTPVKRYSSGMYVRLAFAVAAHLDSDVLLVDEVLAVGDAAFQEKCLNKIDDSARSGKTVVLVSHQLQSIVATCSRALVMDGGRITHDASPSEAVAFYTASVRPQPGRERDRATGSGEMTITRVVVSPPAGFDEHRRIEVHARLNSTVVGSVFATVAIARPTDPRPTVLLDSRLNGQSCAGPQVDLRFTFDMASPLLLPGRWEIEARLGIDGIGWVDTWPAAEELDVLEYGNSATPVANTNTPEGAVVPQFSVEISRADEA